MILKTYLSSVYLPVVIGEYVDAITERIKNENQEAGVDTDIDPIFVRDEAIRAIEARYVEFLSLEPGETPCFDWLVESSLPVINFFRTLVVSDAHLSLLDGDFDFVSLDVMNSCELLITLKWRKG